MNDQNTLLKVCEAIILLPLLASVLTGLFGKMMGRTLSHRFAVSAVGIAFFLSCWVLYAIVTQNVQALNTTLYTWGKSGGISFQIGFLIDQLSSLMMVVVSFVSWMVHIYTIGYMHDDPGYQRFFSYISLFTFGMLMLVMSHNFLQLFFGWEAVGLMSYLLIGFWFQKESANRASLKAFLVNRLGDLGFLIGIAGVLYFFGSLDYSAVFQSAEQLNLDSLVIRWQDTEFSAMTFITLCLFVGAMGKSAQIPLHVWLPDSMEGPTPISALIHAATMVTAGVFMLARMSPLFEYSATTLNVVLTIGALTALLMGILGIVQNDIKRVIAYSTLSQLGYMMTAMGVSAYSIGMFHLMTHAFFKALLFLGAGAVIIALHHEQDIWKMGNLKKYLPITYWTMLIASLALIGFPGFSGFYSKDLIIEAVKLSTLPQAGFAYVVVLGSVVITAIYTFRLFFLVFHSEERINPQSRAHLHESPWVMWVALVLLAIPSLVAGAIFVEPLLKGFFGSSIMSAAHHLDNIPLITEYQNPFSMALHGFVSLPFWFALLGVLIAWLCYIRYPKLPFVIQKKLGIFYYVLKEKYGFDAFNQWVIARGIRWVGWLCWRLGDQTVIDGFMVNGTAFGIGKASRLFRRFQSGYLYHYAFVMITGFLVLIGWLLLF